MSSATGLDNRVLKLIINVRTTEDLQLITDDVQQATEIQYE
jgi:hypothetical protein